MAPGGELVVPTHNDWCGHRYWSSELRTELLNLDPNTGSGATGPSGATSPGGQAIKLRGIWTWDDYRLCTRVVGYTD